MTTARRGGRRGAGGWRSVLRGGVQHVCRSTSRDCLSRQKGCTGTAVRGDEEARRGTCSRGLHPPVEIAGNRAEVGSTARLYSSGKEIEAGSCVPCYGSCQSPLLRPAPNHPRRSWNRPQVRISCLPWAVDVPRITTSKSSGTAAYWWRLPYSPGRGVMRGTTSALSNCPRQSNESLGG